MDLKNKINNEKTIDLEKEIYEFSSETIRLCYGVEGIAKISPRISISSLKTFSKTKKIDGVLIKKFKNGTYSISMYLIIANNVKISEILVEAQKLMIYRLNKKFPLLIKEVNLYAYEISK